MKHYLKIILSLLLLLTGSLIVTLTFAEEGVQRPNMLMKTVIDFKLHKALNSLQLSPSQEVEVKAVFSNAKTELSPRIDYLIDQRKLLRTHIAEGSRSADELLAHFRALQIIQQEIFLERVLFVDKLHQVLTHEQVAIIRRKQIELETNTDEFILALRASLTDWIESE